ncbi:hypothetical protein LK09_13370 [Microbacterium mangrovi]|uniref:DUF4190 domain-containing protein n=1 Tax=Microbacterium mangrovi TaxID=1348253 RepID=A0A0B2A518_9MICO|nr:DUF4190 domain-containing protein [Microbacterium mangrovi]KHK96844.1 hypothetical protein LK09_13370 [Microbacterium mangrovi]
MTDPYNPQPQQPQSPYAGPPAAPAYGAPAYVAPPTNTLAVVSLIAGIASWVVLPFVAAVVAVITGHMSLGRIKQSGESGRGMALAGVILGWVNIGLSILATVLVVVLVLGAFGIAASHGSLNS